VKAKTFEERNLFLKRIGLFLAFVEENSFSQFCGFYLRNRLRIRRLLSLFVLGRKIKIRTASTDYTVAASSFGGEFKTIKCMFERDVEGLIIDAGGYIGTAAIALSEMYPNAKVVSVEASEENFAVLEKNIEAYPNISAINAALMPAGSDETVTFVDRGHQEWGFAVKSENDDKAKVLGTIRTITIEKIMRDFGFDEVLICKMDIEGAERDILNDSKSWVDKTKVVVIELHDKYVPGCRDAFMKASVERFVFKDSGEKYVSVNKSMFSRKHDI
jgi:FkbM family methyltransferase